MFIDFTARDIMLIVFSFIFWIALLHFLWPIIVVCAIKRNPDEGGEKCGERFLLIGIVVLASLYLVLVLTDSKRSWMDAEPAISAILITAAIFFSYGRFLPSSFYVAYMEVTDFKTGGWNKKRLQELTINKGELWPIFLVVHNTGIVSWDNYRITVELGDNFEVHREHDKFPSSKTWTWRTKDEGFTYGKNPCFLQIQRDNTLAIGEPQTLRFLIKAQDVGRFKLKIRVVSNGRPGERHQSLWLKVEDARNK